MRSEPPRRASYEFVQRLNACPSEVFPLLCPVRESEWVEGWDPEVVWTESGVNELGCVFVTPATPGDAIWVTTLHDSDAWRVEFVKVMPRHTVTRIAIQLSAAPPSGCNARVRYEYTAIGPEGVGFLDEFDGAEYEQFMRAWEAALNDYLDRPRPRPGSALE